MTKQASSRVIFTILPLAFATQVFAQTGIVDGQRLAEEYSHELAVQTVTSGWGAGNVLANLHAAQSPTSLHLFLSGRANGNAILLFLDTKPGGRNFVANNTILTGGEANTVNSLGQSPTAGMTWEMGFEPDYALRIYGAGTDAHVNVYNLQTGTRAYAGNSGVGNLSSNFVSSIRTTWQDVAADAYATAASGVEMTLSLNGLGIPQGQHTVKMTAMLVNGNSDYGSNQFLASRNQTADAAGSLSSLNWETDTGAQTLSFTVTFEDSDGDGMADALDPDDDNDLLPDTVETNTGIYVSNTNTGSDPKSADSDEDTYRDNEEVSGTALGYLSDPNVPNHFSMAVPGNYTEPMWLEDGSAGNTMTRVGTAAATQYQWTMDYRFLAPVPRLQFKYAANGTWARQWGTTQSAGGVEAGGENLNAAVPASGFYTFTLDTKSLTQSFLRKTFPTLELFQSAYGITAENADADAWTDAQEYAANTDPLNADSDGDGLPDHTDPNPLVAATAYDIWATAQNLPAASAARTADPDADGFSNAAEFLFGTAPLTANGSLTDIVKLSETTWGVIWLGRGSAASYVVEITDNLAAPWQPSGIATELASSQVGVPSGYTRFQSALPTGFNRQFARVRATEAP